MEADGSKCIDTPRHYEEQESKLDVFVGTLPSEIGEDHKRERGKNVVVIGHGVQENTAH